MTFQALRVPGILFLFAATVLLIITSVSLPYLPVIDFVRSHVESGNIGVADAQGTVTSPSVSQLKVSHLVSDVSGWPLIDVSLGCGLTVPSNHLLEIAIVAPPDTVTPSVFETTARAM